MTASLVDVGTAEDTTTPVFSGQYPRAAAYRDALSLRIKVLSGLDIIEKANALTSLIAKGERVEGVAILREVMRAELMRRYPPFGRRKVAWQ